MTHFCVNLYILLQIAGKLYPGREACCFNLLSVSKNKWKKNQNLKYQLLTIVIGCGEGKVFIFYVISPNHMHREQWWDPFKDQTCAVCWNLTSGKIVILNVRLPKGLDELILGKFSVKISAVVSRFLANRTDSMT